MALPQPKLPDYDVRAWQQRPFAERMRMVCQAWAVDGYGTPSPIYVVYLVKIALYIAGWWAFCRLSPGLGDLSRMGSWWAEPTALQKAIAWSMMFESLGLGCGSGPLTGRYYPPIGGVLYFTRPGTTKMPLVPGLPVLGGDRRTLLDVALYLGLQASLARALIAPAITAAHVAPVLAILAVLGFADKTIFLAARAEHFGSALVCMLFPSVWLPATKVVWLAVWLWAATSKLNVHFPAVIAVMQSNSPLTFGPLRRMLYRSYPDDLRPSRLAHAAAHFGTLAEYAFPLALLAGDGGPVTRAALAGMLLFHLFITSSVPMGVPIEWNVIMVYGAFVLFGHHAEVSVLSLSAEPLLLGYLFLACFTLQAAGNLYPKAISFLCSMRYYAGNWAYSVWLFRGDAAKKLDTHLVKIAPRVQDQLARFYDEITIIAVLSKVMAFRAMHLHGRALQILLPKAVDDIDAYEYLDGEIVAGIVIGYNFGDGHLHDQQLLRAVQRQCGFAEGELRCIFVESQPMFGRSMAFTIADAATGVREEGEIEVRDLLARKPWPEGG